MRITRLSDGETDSKAQLFGIFNECKNARPEAETQNECLFRNSQSSITISARILCSPGSCLGSTLRSSIVVSNFRIIIFIDSLLNTFHSLQKKEIISIIAKPNQGP